jgi:hypothetical protein
VNAEAAELWQRFQEANRLGLRRDATDAMASFIAALTPDDQVRFTRWFCRDRYSRAPDRRMRSHLMPLARDLLVPRLLAGARRGEPESLRLLAHVRLDWAMRTDVIAPQLHDESRAMGLLALALTRNRDAPDLWRIVFDFELWPADWGTHHLGEGILILPEHECLQSIERARCVLAHAPAGALNDYDRAHVDQLEEDVRDYRTWKDSQSSQSFTDWCQQHGRQTHRPVPYYYRRAAGST